jgi:putative endonuclease
MNSTRETGKKAEGVAVDYLLKNGYEILERNWFSHHHEIDVVAKKNKIVVFVEVKSLATDYIREPYMAVDRNKQMMLISAANAYIRSRNIDDEVRFDIISIILASTGTKIEHIENAFYPRVK